MASGVAGSSKTPQPLLVQGVYPQGAPIVVNGDTPKVTIAFDVHYYHLDWHDTPRSLSVCSASPLTDSSPMSPLPSVLPYQHHQAPISTIRPGLQADPRGPITGKMPTSTHWTLPVSDSSTTPDSGIQSVPGSPPSNHPLTPPTVGFTFMILLLISAVLLICEDRIETEEDFADMPRLLPADQEDHALCSASASSIYLFIYLFICIFLESNPKRFRPESAASEELRKSDEEVKVLVVAGNKTLNPTIRISQRESKNPVKSEILPKEDNSNSNSTSRDIHDCRKTYREAVKRMLRAKFFFKFLTKI
uniref:Signal peptide protein n=1 Tax=Heterorhabditis bacteriophora TaxID=37862 RepID=A0A1I7WNF7_HETBA